MEPALQHKKLKRIGLLMLASEFALLLFIGTWIWGQYALQENRMDKDIGLAFHQTYEKINNHLMDVTIDSLLHNGRWQPMSVKVDVNNAIRLDDSPASNIHIRHIRGTTGREMVIATSTTGRPTVIKTDSFTVSSFKQDSAFSNGPEGVPDINQMLRMVLHQSPDNIAGRIKVDPLLFRKEFLAALRKNYGKLGVAWAIDTGQRKFSYAQKNISVQVDGYRYYLLISILPQIGFTLFLLGLTGLAFWMAYRNMKRQWRFAAQKDNFISNMSHELKTPVATTRVALEALSTYNGIDDPVRTRKYLNIAMLEMDRLAALINRVLNTMQTEDGLLHLEFETINLREVIQEASETFSPVMQQQKIAFTPAVFRQDIFVKADRVHLSGVFYNLIDNAVKYGAGKVQITIAETDAAVTINILNNGDRIATEYRDKVFEKFFRVPQGDRHTVKGHGLGLSYAKHIIKEHNGNISLQSAPDKTVFAVTLPKL